MYEELVERLKIAADWAGRGFHITPNLCLEAADAVEKLSHYVVQMDKLREDGWYLLQEEAGTYGPITMKMPIPEPSSCDDVLATING